jgi:hypothetical protein
MKSKLIYIIGASMVATSLVFGTVISINGSRIVVSDQGANGGITRIVDAGEAKITEGLGAGSTPLSVDNLAVGDSVMVFDGKTA